MEIYQKCITQSTLELYRSTSALLKMSSQELNILDRQVVAGTSHDEILVENEVNEAIQKTTVEIHNHIGKQILVDFCDNSTVQGVRYFTKPKLHWIERFFWSAIVVSSLLCCFIGMSYLWEAWNRNPVIVKYDNKITSISKFPFPAITVCPTKKFSIETVNIDKILKALETNYSALEDFTTAELNQMNLIVQTCSNLKSYSLPDEMIILSQASVLETFKNMTNYKNFDTIITSFHEKFYRNSEPILTPEGLCFTFNSLNSDEIYTNETVSDIKTVRNNPRAIQWNRDDGYQSQGNKQNVYPIRPFSSYSQFVALMRISFDDSHKLCNRIALGFHISIHAPDELPPDDFFHISPEQFSTILIKPNVITTSDGLRSYAPHVRNCFFGFERLLQFFRSYTQNNCELECLTNFTRNDCGCVHFSMPRSKSTRVCTMLNTDCYTGAKHTFDTNQIVKNCDCLPDCTSFSYNIEITQARHPFYTKEAEINPMNERFLGKNDTSLSSVVISFKEPNFIKMMRTETGTIYGFISNCGSLLGMCLGVSILSIVELIYFFTLRLYLLWRGKDPAQATAHSHGTLTSIIKKPFEKLKLKLRSKKQKHEIIKVRPICDDDPNQIWNESEMQTEEVAIQKQFCHKIIEDFCNNSTIHGLRYFTESNRHRTERVWWAIAVILSIVVCIIAIFCIWTDWQQSPVITAFDDGRTPIETVPFPAVTICSIKPYIYSEMIAKIFKASIERKLKFEKFSEEELCLINALSQIQPLFDDINHSNITIPSCPSIYETIKSMALDQDSAVDSISWLGQRDQLSLKPIFTQFGRCFSFNSLNSQQIYAEDVLSELKTVHGNPNATYWNSENGYQSNISQDEVYPRRLYGAGIFEGLFARFHTIFDYSDSIFFNNIPGLLELTIHPPHELPGIRFDSLYISSEQDTLVSIRPSLTSTSDGLRSYAPRARGCYYNNERNLRFFKSYSHQNCEWECLTNFTKNKCGCVHFAMPSVAGTKVCTMFDTICCATAKSKYYLENKIEECDCSPDCTSISYNAEISTAPFHFYEDDQTKNVLKFYNRRGYGFHTSMRLFVSFKEDHFTTINRTEIMTMSGFISTCGGLFGLFMGISWLSIVELLYYFTLRLCRKWIKPEADTDSEAEGDAEIQDVQAARFEANSESKINIDTEVETEFQDDSDDSDESNGEYSNIDVVVHAEIHFDGVASISKSQKPD